MFGEALAWFKRYGWRLRDVFDALPTTPVSGGGRTLPAFGCPRQWAIESLVVPSLYFLNRGFTAETLRRYHIGHPTRRGGVFARLKGFAVVPLFDLDGSERCVGYAARRTNDFEEPRWKMSPGLANAQRLFNYHLAREACIRTGRLLLAEGVGDALRCVEAGFPETVSVLGSELLSEQLSRLELLRPREVVVVADNDDAGAKFVRQVRERMAGYAREVRVVCPPTPFKDVGEMTSADARPFMLTMIGHQPAKFAMRP
jgi:5S rRNA maturation endonuclease (ribonuclease M5)